MNINPRTANPETGEQPAAVNTITEIDSTIAFPTTYSAKVTRIWHCGQHTVRVRIDRDFYLKQSYALAEVLTPELTWTQVCDEPAGRWHDQPFGRTEQARAAVQDGLFAVAEALMLRAARILRVPAGQQGARS